MGVTTVAQQVKNLTSIHEDAGSIPSLAPIQPLAWDFPYAVGIALKKERKEKRKEGRKEEIKGENLEQL